MNEAITNELMRLYAAEGALTPARVVEAAANPASVLHECFTWDNNAAAHKYRLVEAGRLIRRVRVTRQTLPEEPPRRVRVFYNVNDQGEAREYQAINVIKTNTDYAQRAEQLARRELETVDKRYRELVDLLRVSREVFTKPKEGQNK